MRCQGGSPSFYNVISEVTYPHFRRILLVPQTSPGTAWEGTSQGSGRDQEAEVTGTSCLRLATPEASNYGRRLIPLFTEASLG